MTYQTFQRDISQSVRYCVNWTSGKKTCGGLTYYGTEEYTFMTTGQLMTFVMFARR